MFPYQGLQGNQITPAWRLDGTKGREWLTMIRSQILPTTSVATYKRLCFQGTGSGIRTAPDVMLIIKMDHDNRKNDQTMCDERDG
jgi:hypothetical protein